MVVERTGLAARLGSLVLLAVGFALAFLLALPVGVALHLDLPLTRRVVLRQVERAMGRELAGTLSVRALRRLDPARIELADLRITGPDGEVALSAGSVALDGPGWLGLVGLLSPAPTLVIPQLAIEHVTLDARPDAGGAPRLATALALRAVPQAPAEPPPPPTAIFWVRKLVLRDVDVVAAGPHGTDLTLTLEALDGALRIEPASLSLEATRIAAHLGRGMPEPVALRARGSVTASRDATGAARPDVDAWAELDIATYLTQITARGALADGRLVAELDVPALHPTTLARWLPEVPILPPAPLRLRARLDGPPEAIAFELQLDHAARAERNFPSGGALPGRVELRGRLDSGRQVAGVDVLVTELDLAALGPSFPATRIAGHTALELDLRARRAHGRLLLARSEAATVGGAVVALPGTSGTFAASSDGVDARLRIDEAGCPGEALVTLGVDRALHFAVRASVPSVGAVERLAALVPTTKALRGSGEVTVTGSFRDGSLDVGAHGVFESLAAPRAGVRAARLELESRVSGKLDDLSLDARAQGRALEVGGRSIVQATVHATGPLRRPKVHAKLDENADDGLDATATIDAARAALYELSVELRRGGAVLSASARGVEVREGGAITASELRVGGGTVPGTLTGDVVIHDGEVTGRLEAWELDLAQLSRVLRLPTPVEGSLDLELELERTGHGERTGYVEVAVRDGGATFVRGIDAEIELDFAKGRVTPRSELAWHDAGGALGCASNLISITTTGDLALDGPLLAAATWKRATGRLGLDASEIDLGCVARLAATLGLGDEAPVSVHGGKATVELALSRSSAAGPSMLERLTVATRSLDLSLKSSLGRASTLRSERLDLALDGSLDGRTGATRLEVRALDATQDRANATLATARLVTRIDPGWLESPPSAARALLQLATTPFEATLDIDRLDAARRTLLPTPLRDAVADVEGELRVAARARGTAVRPEFAARATIAGLAVRARDEVPRVDVDVIATSREGETRVSGWVDLPDPARGAHRLLSLDATHRAPPRRLFGPREPAELDVRAWSGGVPLGIVPGLARRGISGEVAGQLRFKDGEHPTFAARLEAEDTRLGAVVLDRATLVVAPRAEGRAVEANLRLAVRGGGTLEASAATTLARAGAVPTVDPRQPGELSIVARAFPLKTLKPLLPERIARLEGRLEGRLALGFKGIDDDAPSVASTLVVSDGLLSIPEYGQELRDVKARLTAQRGLLSVEGVSAVTPSGPLRGRFDARFAGVAPIDFTGRLETTEGEGLALAYDGRSLGNLRGIVTLRGERRSEGGYD
ncbi:MAG: hypothetical protein FJ096_17970, partial [Deltaproteobacteria bacterium]|nr:hypothetical protein [Deltaproteobacteria bacterium]